jgi:hypothetical protein
MLNVRLEGCGWSKDLGQVPSLRVDSGALQTAEHGDIARYEAGYWCASDGFYISVLVTPKCFVSFDDGDEHTAAFGSYSQVRSSGGSIWAAEPHERLLARWDEGRRGWHCLLHPGRLWPVVIVAALPFER